MRVSVVICTRDRADSLGRCLSYIQEIEFEDAWHLVIIDNGSTDHTREVVETARAEGRIEIDYVYEALPGLARARNAARPFVKGDLIFFTDDDCYVAPDILTALEAAFEDPQTGFVSGRIMLFDPTDYPATINESTDCVVFEANSFIRAGAVKGASLGFRTEVLEDIDWFDPLFGAGAHFASEDCDAAGRASLANWRGRYVPEMVVHHHHGRKASDIGGLLKAYAIGRGAYHTKLFYVPGGKRASLKGWVGALRRSIRRPSNLFWELRGGFGYLRKRGLPDGAGIRAT
ncbi:MAG: glycosyltransferase family 2 protein [Pseudomonadota bacterium]